MLTGRFGRRSANNILCVKCRCSVNCLVQRLVWPKAIQSSADPQRAGRFLEQLKATGGVTGFLNRASPEQARVLAALFGGSQALSELVVARPDWLQVCLVAENLQHPRQKQGLERDLEGSLKPLLKDGNNSAAMTAVREFKQREMLRIAARDLARLANAAEITLEISNVADLCLETVYGLCRRQLAPRFGQPYHLVPENNWQKTEFAILGMGKLGGQELNYSSDVDLLFVYSEEGHLFKELPRTSSVAGKGLANFQFFKRLAEMFIHEVSRLTPEGTLFRIDMRLRPEGPTAPLARSLGSYENYYAQWGQTWERMMLIKARRVAGDELLASEFLEMVQPFRYPRSVSGRIFDEVTATKRRIETEVVKAGEIDRNVKLGHGGIREIEFVTQALQLLHGGRTPFLQGPQTLTVLQKLVDYRLLPQADAEALSAAYVFLRDVEHRLQMENNLQTHTIPTERKARERLAKLMGFATVDDFERTRHRHTRNVRDIYDRLLKSETPKPRSPLPPALDGAEPDWKRLLAEHGFRDTDKALRTVKEFLEGPGYVHVSARTEELGRDLLTKFLQHCPRKSKTRLESEPDQNKGTDGPANSVLSDPDRVLVRMDSFIAAYGARATLYELWTRNPSLFELLLLLFDRSEFLAEIAIRTPDLVDELELSGRLRRCKKAEEILDDLRHGRDDADQKLWLRRYHQAEFMRIGLRDILGLADFEQNLTELSTLADGCLQYALEVVLRKNKRQYAPFAIIGLGKLGGQELNYGSDLDIIFVAENRARDLALLQKLAVEIMDLLSGQTELGIAFVTDARLRPDGEKGLLVNTLSAYEEYYRQRAHLWEIQALTRTRFVAGNARVGMEYQRLTSTLTNFARPAWPLTALSPGWKEGIARMRQRIEKERTPAGQQALAIKTGSGGLIDAEFIAQTLALQHGWPEPNTLRALQRGLESGALPRAQGEKLIENYRELRRIEGILRRWSFEGETALPADPAPLYRVALRCGFSSSEEFLESVGRYRAALRESYRTIFG